MNKNDPTVFVLFWFIVDGNVLLSFLYEFYDLKKNEIKSRGSSEGILMFIGDVVLFICGEQLYPLIVQLNAIDLCTLYIMYEYEEKSLLKVLTVQE